MRPLELSLEGFTSFRREQCLNFSELDLFAITGATGAGKSSLLDAITFALFGTTIRSSKNISDLVSQGSETLKVQFRFSVGSTQYRILRRWRYRPKSPENKVLLEAFQNGDWEPLANSSTTVLNTVEQILGMDFDTFTRVIILPQGKFDEFLKGDAAKRREILRQLAGFEIFEQMRKEATDLTKLLKTERETRERQLEELEAPAPEEFAAKQAQLATLEAEIPQLNQAVSASQKALAEAEQLFHQIQRQQDLQATLARLQARRSELQSLEQQLEKAQIANHLQADWARLDEARKQLQEAEKNLTVTQQKLREAQENLNRQQQRRTEVEGRQNEQLPKLRSREEALATAKVYEEQFSALEAEVAGIQTAQAEKNQAVKGAKKELEKADNQLQTSGFQVAEARAALEQNLLAGERLEQLNTIAPLLTEYKVIAKQRKEQHQQLLKTAQAQLTAAQVYTQAHERLKLAETALKHCQDTLKKAEENNAETARLHQAVAIRRSLNPGDTCPVCGGIHPEPHQLPNLPELDLIEIAPLQAQLATANQTFQEASFQEIKLKSDLSHYQEIESDLTHSLQQSEADLAQLREQIDRVLGGEPILSDFEPQSLEKEWEILKERDRKFRQAEQRLQQAETAFNQAQNIRELAQATLLAKQTEYQTVSEAVEGRRQALQAVADKLYKLTGNQSYEALFKALNQEKNHLERELKEAEATYQTASNHLIRATEQHRQAEERIQEDRNKNQQLSREWDAKLQAVNFTEEIFLKAAASAKQQTQWEQELRQYRESLIQTETRLKDLTDTISEQTMNETILEQHRAQEKDVKNQLKQANDCRAELLVWIQVANKNQEQATRLAEEITTFTEQEAIYQTLAQNLKSNEFQDYILEHLQAELVAGATQILQELTESRYALKIQEGEYWVEDNWNGGELRRVRTLSGGETFATSLSMALALSEKLAQGAQLGSLFLDEGFGTLDAETLESVTQILESLRQQDRLIGIITHVRALAERLPTQIKVEKSPQGSKIKIERI